MIHMDHVTFTYQSNAAGGVRDIDLTIPEGQVAVLCGESGCGKTTVTRLINGLIPHYFEGKLSGSVHVGGKDVARQALMADGSTGSRQTAALRDFRFAYKNATETLHIGDADIPYGGIIGIIGHNGAGKSTFSRCFCGLEKRCGTVTVDGIAFRPKERLNRCYMVMQDVGHQLFTESVLDEVLISMAEEDETAVKDILARLDLTPYLERHPASLSGGQKQRLAIASAMAAERSVVFLDEPTSSLDYRHMLQTAQLLKELRQNGKTVYVITQDPELICQCCTDILHLEAGHIAACYPMDAAGVGRIRDFFRVDGVTT